MKGIYFTYPDAITFSGQTAASEQIIDLLSNVEEFMFLPNPFPAFGHKAKNKGTFKFFIKILKFYYLNFKILFKNPEIIYLNLGQSYSKLLFHALPILYVKYFCKSDLVISLHGNLFLDWPEKSFKQYLFKLILKNGSLVTYLGDNQRLKLEELGIKKIKQVNNCITTESITDEFILNKQNSTKLNILHLSLLIESKGFNKFLEAFGSDDILEMRSKFSMTLCGPVHFTSEKENFLSVEDKVKWINSILQNLRSRNVEAEWIKGAKGHKKDVILKNASIFVFPSNFSVESQPLVLLEAAANGCAIITSKKGEIGNMFKEDEVLFLNDNSTESIRESIKFLLNNPNERIKLAKKSYAKYLEKYSNKKYKKTWYNIFRKL